MKLYLIKKPELFDKFDWTLAIRVIYGIECFDWEDYKLDKDFIKREIN